MKHSNRLISLLLILVLVIPFVLGGCSSRESALTYGKSSISEKEYQFYVASYKGSFAKTYTDFEDTEDFYTHPVGNITAGEQMNERVIQNTAILLICDDWFRELGLKMPKEAVKAVDDRIEDLSGQYFSKGAPIPLNKILAPYGINKSILKDIYLREQKSSMVFNYFYGSNGQTPVTDEQRADYMENNMVHIQQVYVNDKFVYNLDEEGNYTYGANGRIETNDLTEEELAAKAERIAEIDRAFADGADFDEVYQTLSEDIQYPNGYYISHNIDFVPEVVSAAFDMEVGEWRKVESSIGVHYIKRLELEEKAWENEANKDFFSDYTSVVARADFMKVLQEKLAKVVRNEEVIAKHKIEDSNMNFTF